MQTSMSTWLPTMTLLVTCAVWQVHGILVKIKPGSISQVTGEINVTQIDTGVSFKGYITGLTPGFHGFHIHENGALGENCKDAGRHFNPYQNPHGNPKDKFRHVGDLGNVEANKTGYAIVDIHDELASLDPTSDTFIGNRAVVIHEKDDDMGRGDNDASKVEGNAGLRAGCGIIEYGPVHPKGGAALKNQDHIVNIQPGSVPGVSGQLEVVAVDSGVVIRGQVSGLAPGLHGFHIHENGALGENCRDAGRHYNPYQNPHGNPKDKFRHVGDLGNVEVNKSGVAMVNIHDELASLDPASDTFIGNRAVVIHEHADDMGRGDNDASKVEGNAGLRAACGIIEVKKEVKKLEQDGHSASSNKSALPVVPKPKMTSGQSPSIILPAQMALGCIILTLIRQNIFSNF